MRSKKTIYLHFIIICFCLLLTEAWGQNEELIITESGQQSEESLRPEDSLRNVVPGKAALYSTIFPGGGQIYNRKYWKLPIVYLALGTATYAAVWNHQQAQIYLDAFYEQTDPDNTDPDFFGIYTEAQLIELYYQHRRWKDLSIIVGAVLYGLQILDAYVDAHLYHYDMSDDISLRWEPTLINSSLSGIPAMGLGVTLSFK